MKRSTVIDWHRWLAVPFAVALLVWLGSGLVLISPNVTPDALGAYREVPVDWHEVGVSPADVVGVLRALGDTSRVTDVTLTRLGDAPVYRARTARTSRLVDARTGALVHVDDEVAERVARMRVKPDVETESVELVTSYDWLYPRGPLPAYRVRFRTGDHSWGYVAVETGEVYYSSRATRVRAALVSFHDFGILRQILGGWIPNRLLLLAACAGMLLVACTGYYLALWRLRRPRSRSLDAERT